MMSVHPNQRLSWVFATLGQCVVSSKPDLFRPQTHTTKLLDAKIGRLREQNQYHSKRWSFLEFLTFVSDKRSLRSLCGLSRVSKNRNNQIPQLERSNLNPASKEMFLILLNCAKLKFVSYTSNWLEQMYDFQNRTMFHQKWISNLQDLPAKSESWNSPNLHCLAVLPTWQYCLYSHVWWM